MRTWEGITPSRPVRGWARGALPVVGRILTNPAGHKPDSEPRTLALRTRQQPASPWAVNRGTHFRSQAERAGCSPTAFPTMKTILTADWAPHIEAAVRRLAQLCTIVYVAGYCCGAWLHRLNDALAREWVAALGVLDRPAAPLDPRQAPLDMAPAPLDPLPIVATTRHAMPTGIDHARHLVAAGHSQRQAARRAGVSRTSLQRALAAA
jgi:lambda repressor-like predicted transcriptional regulator